MPASEIFPAGYGVEGNGETPTRRETGVLQETEGCNAKHRRNVEDAPERRQALTDSREPAQACLLDIPCR